MPLNGVSAAMRERVSQQLREIERRYDVKVLYACESGAAAGDLPRPTATTMYGFVCSPAGMVSASRGAARCY